MKIFLTFLTPIVLSMSFCTPLDEYYSHTHTQEPGSSTHRISIELVLSIVHDGSVTTNDFIAQTIAIGGPETGKGSELLYYSVMCCQ